MFRIIVEFFPLLCVREQEGALDKGGWRSFTSIEIPEFEGFSSGEPKSYIHLFRRFLPMSNGRTYVLQALFSSHIRKYRCGSAEQLLSTRSCLVGVCHVVLAGPSRCT